MKSFLKYLFLIPVALIVLALSAANRHLVTIFLDPFAGHTSEGTQIVVPLYIVMLLAAMFGIVLGGVTTWLEQGTYRRAARRARSEVNVLRGGSRAVILWRARLKNGRSRRQETSRVQDGAADVCTGFVTMVIYFAIIDAGNVA